MGNSKGKGSAFEREIANKLSLWWTEGERDDIFWRSDNSGGRATMRRKAGKLTEGQAGDITYRDPIGKPLIDVFNIEAKTGYAQKSKNKTGETVTNWSLLDLIDSNQKDPVFLKFWRQSSEEAEVTNREPILIFRRNRRKACICLCDDIFLWLVFYAQEKGVNLKLGDVSDILNIKHKNTNLIIMNFDEFLNLFIEPQKYFLNESE